MSKFTSQDMSKVNACRDQTSEKIEELMSRVSELDDEILDKLVARRSMLESIAFLHQTLMMTEDVLGVSVEDLTQALYEPNSEFDNSVVRDAVSHLRSVLFDDTDPVSQSFECVSVEECRSWRDSFKFDFSNGLTEFHVYVNFRPLGPKYYVDGEYFGCAISLSYHQSEYNEEHFAASNDFREIAQAVKDFIHATNRVQLPYSHNKQFIDDMMRAAGASNTYD